MKGCTGEYKLWGNCTINHHLLRLKYERTKSDLENAKRRLVEQHEEDLEQTMMMKKQMEKKIIEATEEVEESKRDSAQWKNKYKKVQVSSYFKKYYWYNEYKIRLKWMRLE